MIAIIGRADRQSLAMVRVRRVAATVAPFFDLEAVDDVAERFTNEGKPGSIWNQAPAGHWITKTLPDIDISVCNVCGRWPAHP